MILFYKSLLTVFTYFDFPRGHYCWRSMGCLSQRMYLYTVSSLGTRVLNRHFKKENAALSTGISFHHSFQLK